jgi:hypothetical protein
MLDILDEEELMAPTGNRPIEPIKKVFISKESRPYKGHGYMQGFVVKIYPDFKETFHLSLEEALRRVIFGLGLEEREIIVLDSIPGVSGE